MAATDKAEVTTMAALESFVGRVDDIEVIFRRGDPVKSNNPAVKKWPHLFGPAHFPNEIEQATAAPGEKR